MSFLAAMLAQIIERPNLNVPSAIAYSYIHKNTQLIIDMKCVFLSYSVVHKN